MAPMTSAIASNTAVNNNETLRTTFIDSLYPWRPFGLPALEPSPLSCLDATSHVDLPSCHGVIRRILHWAHGRRTTPTEHRAEATRRWFPYSIDDRSARWE